MAVESPCTNVCSYEPKRKWCIGCGRTADEIKAWRKLSPFRQRVLNKELKRRMQVLSEKADS
jgi:predicted Fe-S protein YdhL (DUF1289 family)